MNNIPIVGCEVRSRATGSVWVLKEDNYWYVVEAGTANHKKGQRSSFKCDGTSLSSNWEILPMKSTKFIDIYDKLNN
jgi:hypothetical protein